MKKRHRPRRCRSHREVIDRKKSSLIHVEYGPPVMADVMWMHWQLELLHREMLKRLFTVDRVDDRGQNAAQAEEVRHD